MLKTETITVCNMYCDRCSIKLEKMAETPAVIGAQVQNWYVALEPQDSLQHLCEDCKWKKDEPLPEKPAQPPLTEHELRFPGDSLDEMDRLCDPVRRRVLDECIRRARQDGNARIPVATVRLAFVSAVLALVQEALQP